MLRRKSFTAEDEVRDLGFGARVVQLSRTRLLNRDGSFNLRRKGRPGWKSLTTYHSLLTMPWWKFHAFIITLFVGINAVFAIAFTLAGRDAVTGVVPGSWVEQCVEDFFFSVQTFTTVGYGGLAPHGLVGNVLAVADVFVGLLSFALATGLFFARFARPTAKIVFSDNALVAPYRGGTALEFRIVNARDNQLIEVEVKVLFSYWVEVDGARRKRFDELALERRTVAFFPLSWTIVHAITPESPMAGMSARDLADAEAEFLILITAIDETFSQTVHTRSSYVHSEIVWNAKFSDILRTRDDGEIAVDLHRLSAYDTVPAANAPPA
jgi:inward rectifier potassium channel